MDYGKYRYAEEQKAKLARKHQTQIHIKEIKLRPKIGVHDFETKKGHVVRFLNQRAKVKVTIMFRGRETTHPERGRDLLLRLAEDVKEIGQIESQPLLDGRNMVMVLGPTKAAGEEDEGRGRARSDGGAAGRSGRGARSSSPGGGRRGAQAGSTGTEAKAAPKPKAEKSEATAAAEPEAERRKLKTDAKAEDPQRREEALQDDRHGQARPPARHEEPQPRGPVEEGQARLRQGHPRRQGRRPRVKKLLGRGLS